MVHGQHYRTPHLRDTGSQGVYATKSRGSKFLPIFSSLLNNPCSLGRAVGGWELDLVCSVFILHASGALSCVWGRLFVFILHFFSEVYDFFIRVKICQVAISGCLEITRLWNLLKHKCQKKITTEFVWPFLVYSLMLTFLSLLTYAFCAGELKKKENPTKPFVKMMLQLLTGFACLQRAGSVCV